MSKINITQLIKDKDEDINNLKYKEIIKNKNDKILKFKSNYDK